MEKINVLVTGACGVTSRSVVRSLNKSELFKDKLRFIGTDVCYNRYGIYEGLYDKVYKVPGYNAPEYREVMEKIIADNDIKYAVIIPEPEVLYWSEHPFDVRFHKIPPRFSKAVLSKLSLYKLLEGTGLTPDYQIIPKLVEPENIKLDFPLWIRDYSEGTTSGTGSFMPKNFEQLRSWVNINDNIDTFMLSEYLPGRNLACFLLYDNGQLLKYGVAERQVYLMAKVAVSKITGNTNQGKLLNDDKVFEVARTAVERIAAITGETMNGLIVVDLKENADGQPLVTEINIRHVAFTSSFANAGLNFAETQFLILTDQKDKISPEKTLIFPKDNLILRDVDGLPIYLESFSEVNPGECYTK
ncbi:MAG: hypothetical protein K2H47_00515 [Muribaculaceae bacterium]|nr:hypothetical protein [Muribaculaceae bacterium]